MNAREVIAIGKYVSIGDHARAMIAIGDTMAVGSVYQKSGELIAQNVTVLELTQQEIITIKSLIDTTAPSYL